MKKMRMKAQSLFWFPSVLFWVFSFPDAAVAETGTLTMVEGEVHLYSHPTSAKGGKLKGPPPHGKFEGKFYSVREAKIGNRVKTGNVIRALPNGKARIVYDNGDQFNIGSSTSFRVVSSSSSLQLDYGKLRTVVSPKGPRRKLRIRTKSATMGVRGTDFFVSDFGHLGRTKVSVLRGKVDVRSNTKTRSRKKIEVKSGYKAEVTAKKEVVDQVNRAELIQIQQQSSIKTRLDRQIAQDVKKKVQKLEEKAFSMTLKDIQSTDPGLLESVQKGKQTRTAQALNTAVVKTILKTAPKAKLKPYENELMDLDQDAYEKYFRLDD